MKKIAFLSLFAVALVGLMMLPSSTQTAGAQTTGACGEARGSENFGFTLPNSNLPHWTVNGEGYVSQDSLNQVDVILDKLNVDNIAQTMILIIPSEQVAVGPNCAGDFYEYMQLGNFNGPRADNGFAWVIAYDKQSDSVVLNYAPGPSLNALLATDLKPMERAGAEIYESTHSLDAVLLQTITAFDAYARQKYEPYYEPASTDEPQTIPTPINKPIGFVGLCLTCIALLVVLAILYWLLKNVKITPGTGNYRPRPYNGGNNGNGGGLGLGQPRQNNPKSSTPKTGGGGRPPTRVG